MVHLFGRSRRDIDGMVAAEVPQPFIIAIRTIHLQSLASMLQHHHHPPIYTCIRPSIHFSTHASTHPFIHPATHPSVHPLIQVHAHPFVHPSTYSHLFIILSTHSWIHSSTHPSPINLSIHLSVHTPTHPSISNHPPIQQAIDLSIQTTFVHASIHPPIYAVPRSLCTQCWLGCRSAGQV
jgi:hypothetical protein